MRRAVQPRLHALGHFFHPLNTLEGRLGLAAAAYELVAALPAVVAYFGPAPARTWAAIADHEARLAEILLHCLGRCAGGTGFGEPGADSAVRVPTVSFVVKGVASGDVVRAVERESSFGIRNGHMYAKRLVEEVLGQGPEGVVSISLVHYNTGGSIESWLEDG